MSHASSDDSWEEHTPWDHRDGTPPRSSHDNAPRGPPPPVPVNGPAPAAAPPIADTPPSADAAADASGREGGAARWEHDHGDGPQPVALLDENGVRRIARVAGPLLPSGRFEASSSSSSSDSADDEEDDHEDIADDAVCSPDHGR